MKAVLVVVAALFALIPLHARASDEAAALLHVSPVIHMAQTTYDGRAMYEVSVAGSDAHGYVSPGSVDGGVLSNGQTVKLIPLYSGGTGVYFYFLVFTRYSGQTHFVGYIPSPDGHLDVRVKNGMLEIMTPVYGPNDGSCCPSKWRYQLATVSGIKLHVDKEWVTSKQP